MFELLIKLLIKAFPHGTFFYRLYVIFSLRGRFPYIQTEYIRFTCLHYQLVVRILEFLYLFYYFLSCLLPFVERKDERKTERQETISCLSLVRAMLT